MEGRRKDYSVSYLKHRRCGIIGILVVLVLIIGVAGSDLTEAKVQKAQKTNSDSMKVENRGCETMELNPLRLEEYPEVTSAVKEYYKRLGEKASFVESYDDVSVYTKQGKYKGTYVAFARYDMKIKDIYTKVPGLGTVYVEADQEGAWKVSPDVDDEGVKAYIQEIAQHEDVQALMNETQEAYHEAVQSDALLQEALMDLKDAYEDSTGS
ncbi:hypothetical protein ACQRBN_03275 [Bariatricus sp. SGI.154]|uniref:hypothetical protein n=1 Tax=Bariatricus sp. SGI.154 TaxID=3420549 RepID=UPI003CFEF9E2